MKKIYIVFTKQYTDCECRNWRVEREYVKTDNIYTSMLMHIFHNTVFTIISVIGAGVIIW